jgi:hypothetical protein
MFFEYSRQPYSFLPLLSFVWWELISQYYHNFEQFMGMLETNFLIRAEGYNVWFAEWNSILGVSDSYALVMDFMEWYYKVTNYLKGKV